MTLKDIAPDTIIKFGMADGGGYLYCGRAGDIDTRKLNAACENDAWQIMFASSLYYHRRSGVSVTKGALLRMLKLEKEISNFIPIEDREIIEYEPSIAEKGVYRVIIPGMMTGKKWLVDESPKPVKIKSEEGVIALYGAYIKQTASPLMECYSRICKAKKGQYDADVVVAKQLEENISSGVVRMCRAITVRELCYKDGVMIFPPKKMYKKLKKRLGEKNDERSDN